MKKISDIRAESNDQLTCRLGELDAEIFQQRNQLARSHKLEKPHRIKEYKKEKARILTILTERKGQGQ